MALRSFWLAAGLALAACSEPDDNSTGSPPGDTDSTPVTTPCGDDNCDQATELCAACNCGGPTTYQCVALPAECADDRSCACLGDAICSFAVVEATCLDDPADNTILCETGMD